MFTEPLESLLKSRKFMVALAAIGSYLIVLALPDLRPHQSDIAVILLTLAGMVIGGISLEDAARNFRQPVDLDSAVRDIMAEVLDQLLGKSDSADDTKTE